MPSPRHLSVPYYAHLFHNARCTPNPKTTLATPDSSSNTTRHHLMPPPQHRQHPAATTQPLTSHDTYEAPPSCQPAGTSTPALLCCALLHVSDIPNSIWHSRHTARCAPCRRRHVGPIQQQLLRVRRQTVECNEHATVCLRLACYCGRSMQHWGHVIPGADADTS
jgi:hypothetical protein